MRNRVAALAVLMWITSAVWSAPLTAGPQAPVRPAAAAAHSSAEYGAAITKYCVTCHNDRAKTGGLTLEKMDLGNLGAGADVWERVVRKVRVGMMPPQGSPQPDRDTRAGLVSWLTTSLDRAALANPNPGRPLVHRLNRAEYANAIRDLLALEVDSSALLPPDDAAYGFDNIADALGVSPVLLERYLTAADKITSLAVGDPETQTAGASRDKPEYAVLTQRRAVTPLMKRHALSDCTQPVVP